MFMPLGPVELLFVLFEMATCTCVKIRRISSVGRFWIVWSIYVLILFVLYVCELFMKCFCFVYVNDGCFSSKANASVLLCRLFLLYSFAMVLHKEWGLCL